MNLTDETNFVFFCVFHKEYVKDYEAHRDCFEHGLVTGWERIAQGRRRR